MSPDPSSPPEAEVEQEVNLRRYWNAIVARIWLPLGGLVLGAILGYAVTLGGNTVYQAEALVYLGQPLSPSGSVSVQGLATNPGTTREIISSVAALREAARVSGLPFAKLRGHVSTTSVATTVGKKTASGVTPLVRVKVTGPAPAKVALAANTLANRVVKGVSGYVDIKITTFTAQLAAQDAALASLDRRSRVLNTALSSVRTSPIEQLLLVNQQDTIEQRRASLLDQKATTQQLLALAKTVEAAHIVAPAVAVNSTARSTRNSLLVGAVIGLLLGLVAAVVWDPVVAWVARRRAV